MTRLDDPLCQGQADLFASTDPVDHAEAAQLCGECSFLDPCRQEAEKGHVWGTWAGELYDDDAHRARRVVRPRSSIRRIRDEDATWTAAEANAAHNAFNAARHKGKLAELPASVRIGERVYQRLKKRRQSAVRAAS